MIRLQDDILNIYNSLTDFSANTLLSPVKLPIRVTYSESLNALCFEQKGLKIAISILNYYCRELNNLRNTYLYPEDYDRLMSSLSGLISSGVLLHDRICLSPDKYGFSLYDTEQKITLLKKGPQLLTSIKFVSGNSWFFKKVTQFRYKNLL